MSTSWSDGRLLQLRTQYICICILADFCRLSATSAGRLMSAAITTLSRFNFFCGIKLLVCLAKCSVPVNCFYFIFMQYQVGNAVQLSAAADAINASCRRLRQLRAFVAPHWRRGHDTATGGASGHVSQWATNCKRCLTLS